jgi:acid phosphatase (class A)
MVALVGSHSVMKCSVCISAVLTGSLVLAQGPAALAQASMPELEARRYQLVLSKPPAPGSRAEADDLAILRWNQRTRTPEGILQSWRFLNHNLSAF